MKNLPLVLLDANVIIEAFRRNVWKSLSDKYQLFVPCTVLEEEVFYFQSKQGKEGISLTPAIEAGKLKELSALDAELQAFHSLLHPHFHLSIDPGEKEALALLLSKRCKDHLFCTADGKAIQALAILSRSEQGLSFEKLVKDKVPSLPHYLSEKWFRQQLQRGVEERHLWKLGG